MHAPHAHMCTTCIQLKVHICVSYIHTCTTKHTFMHGCTMYTYMHHKKHVCIDTQTCTICTHASPIKGAYMSIIYTHASPNTYICIDAYTHTYNTWTTKNLHSHTCTNKHTCAPPNITKTKYT